MTLNLKHTRYKPFDLIKDILIDYSEMKRFLLDGYLEVFDSGKINDFMGYKYCHVGDSLKPELINGILDKLEIERLIECVK